MLDAEHLRIVFRVNGIGFVMPAADLLVIRGAVDEDVPRPGGDWLGSEPGYILCRGAKTRIYGFSALFGMDQDNRKEAGQLLVFAGSDCPWAIRVDQVVGVFDRAQCEYKDLPPYLLKGDDMPYRQVALFEEQLLVVTDAWQLEKAWCGEK